MSRAAALLVGAGALLFLASAISPLTSDQNAPAPAGEGDFAGTLGELVDAAAAPVAFEVLSLIEQVIPIGPSAQEYTSMTAETNVAAFLSMIRFAEGTAGPEGYRTMFGGELVATLADHPRRVNTFMLGGRPISSSAAGAYQFLSTTWDECARALKLPDFGPASQDAAAVFLIRRRGALADVREGRFEAAIAKCAREWASLPGSPYGQPVKTINQVRAVYEAAGGVVA